MVEGAMRHGTSMEVEQNFVDSHGASFVGFGITRLLDFDLLRRFTSETTHPAYAAMLETWEGVVTDADRRGLTPIFHANMTPYGEIQLRTDRRLDLAGVPPHGGVSP